MHPYTPLATNDAPLRGGGRTSMGKNVLSFNDHFLRDQPAFLQSTRTRILKHPAAQWSVL